MWRSSYLILNNNNIIDNKNNNNNQMINKYERKKNRDRSFEYISKVITERSGVSTNFFDVLPIMRE